VNDMPGSLDLLRDAF